MNRSAPSKAAAASPPGAAEGISAPLDFAARARLAQGRFRLGESVERRGHRRSVDDFFRSLAAEQKERAIAIVLSGTGTNGTAGAQAIKAAGGLCIAQDPDSAQFSGMPSSLVQSGYAGAAPCRRALQEMLAGSANAP